MRDEEFVDGLEDGHLCSHETRKSEPLFQAKEPRHHSRPMTYVSLRDSNIISNHYRDALR